MFSKAAVFLLTSTLAVCRLKGSTSSNEDTSGPKESGDQRQVVDWCSWLASVQPLPQGWECLTLPGYHSTGGFGTKEFPLQTTFDACNLAEGSLPLLFKSEPPFEKIYEYKSELAVKAGVSVDLGVLKVPFLGGISVSTNVDRAVEISVKVRLKEAHLERLVNLPVAFSQSPNANKICRESLCEPQTVVTAQVFAAAPEIILESSSEFTVATGASILKIIKAHGSVEKDTSTKNTLSAPKPVVLASHQAQAVSYAGSFCTPKWSCVDPSIRIHADCELGGLGAKNSDDRTVTSFGDHGAGTFCQHDAPNTGHAKVSARCAAEDSVVKLDYSVDLFAKGGFTKSDDCKDEPPADKCFTKVGFQTFAGGAFVDIPPTSAYDIKVIEISGCADLLNFRDAKGESVELRTGGKHSVELAGRYTAQFAGEKTFKQGSTDEDRYHPHCNATLKVEQRK